MLDWKIMAASFVSLLLVSSVIFAGTGQGGGIFGDILDSLKGWLEQSPFSSVFSSTPAAQKQVHIFLYPGSLTFSPSAPLNMTYDNTVVEHFSGSLTADFNEEYLLLQSSAGDMSIKMPLSEAMVTGFQTSFTSDSLSFTVIGPESNITGTNTSIDIVSFRGILRIHQDSLELQGNATRVRGNDWEMQ